MTTGELLVDYSTLSSGTALDHFLNIEPGGIGSVTKIYIAKDIDMEITADQNAINVEVTPEYLGVDFEVEMIKKEIKIEATWQRN